MKRVALAASLLLLVALAACATSELDAIVLDGHELHVSLASKQLGGANHGVPRGVVDNPHLSTDAEVVASIARNASQGQLGGAGIRAALFALYDGESELGYYALEATSTGYADQLESTLRAIWNGMVQQDRVRIHRAGQVFVVVWHDGVSPACWQAANDGLVERLATR